MAESRLIQMEYYDAKAKVRLSAYADTIIYERTKNGNIVAAVRFGGYPEKVRAMADAIYGGVTFEATVLGKLLLMQCKPKGYEQLLSHDGIYATATLLAKDDAQVVGNEDTDEPEKGEDPNCQPRTCYIFCPARDRDGLFEELDRKTAAPLIPEFGDYVIDALLDRGYLR